MPAQDAKGTHGEKNTKSETGDAAEEKFHAV
jgi:hypothetical protein